MKISNQQAPKTEEPRKKHVVLWVAFICSMLLLGVGLAAFMIHYDASPIESDSVSADTAVDEPVIEDRGIGQLEVEQAVEDALAEQAVTYQETIDALKAQLIQFEQDDIEGYQAQVDDLRQENESLREVNDELKEANQSLSASNAELTERTTVAEVQEAYDAQIKQLEEDNKKLEDLLQHIQERLEAGQ